MAKQRGDSRKIFVVTCLALTVASCGGGTNSNETLAPLPTTATTTPSTLAPISTTSSVAPSSTTSSSSTTTTIASAAALVLRGDGLGEARFGVDPEGVLTYVKSVLGQPSSDTGYVDPFSQFGTCPGTQVRGVRWGDLLLLFGDESAFAAGRLHFFGWQYGPTAGSAPVPLGMVTDGDLSLGSYVSEILTVNPTADIFNDDVFGAGFELEPTLSGSLTSDSAQGVVITMYGGITCGE